MSGRVSTNVECTGAEAFRRCAWGAPPCACVAKERGSVLVESAFTVSLLFMLLIGIFWLGRGFNTYATMTRAAREGARLAVTPSCAMCGNQYPSDGDITAAINTALDASALDSSQVSSLQILRNQVLNPSSTIIERGVIISFNYPFQLFLPFTPIGLSNYTLSAQVQMREEK